MEENQYEYRKGTGQADTTSAHAALPGIAFATLVVTGETIAICRGAPGYFRVATTKTAEELNLMYGVSPVQARAMLTSSLRGWKHRSILGTADQGNDCVRQ